MGGCADWFTGREFLWELIGKSVGARWLPSHCIRRGLWLRGMHRGERGECLMCGYADVRMCGLVYGTGVSLGMDWQIYWRAQGSPHTASDEAFG